MIYSDLRTILLVTLFSLSTFAASAQAGKDDIERGKLIIATDRIKHGGFVHSVVYITENNKGGAFGLIINRPTPFGIKELLPEQKRDDKIFFGGPMHTQFTFMLAEGKLKGKTPLHPIGSDIFFGAGESSLKQVITDPGARHIRTFAGFVSWGPEELQREVKDGLWLVVPASSGDIFSEHPDDLWQNLISKWGGDWT